jgi:signal transduction histidine kinase
MSRRARDESTQRSSDERAKSESQPVDLDGGRLEQLLAVVSHDLKSPLSAIMMAAAALLRADGAEYRTPQIQKKAEAIQRSAERMARMIEDMADFASIQSGQLVIECGPERASELLTNVVQKFTAAAHERAIDLRTLPCADLPAIACDRERIVQVLSSLVANAIKVTSSGGQVSIGAERKGDEVVFSVQDGGPGLSADELPGIFDQAWRSRDSIYKGTGLGLTVAKGVVEAHQGSIWVDSKLGSGSRFSFTVPIIAALAEQPRSIA